MELRVELRGLVFENLVHSHRIFIEMLVCCKGSSLLYNNLVAKKEGKEVKLASSGYKLTQ